jgi:hypothetical protein
MWNPRQQFSFALSRSQSPSSNNAGPPRPGEGEQRSPILGSPARAKFPNLNCILTLTDIEGRRSRRNSCSRNCPDVQKTPLFWLPHLIDSLAQVQIYQLFDKQLFSEPGSRQIWRLNLRELIRCATEGFSEPRFGPVSGLRSKKVNSSLLLPAGSAPVQRGLFMWCD